MITDIDKLIEDHWWYVCGILEVDGLTTGEIERIGYHYRTAFKHGFKHAKEEETTA